jgi:ABC-type sugar transport system ATPase subunit
VSESEATSPLLAFENVSKRFGGVAALTDVSFAVRPGAVHALVGENGAGKSTLMKCLVGVHAPDAGRILWKGRPVAIPDATAARRLGIDIVFQEIELAPNLTVAESIFLGREPRRGAGPLGLVDYGAMRAEAARLLAQLDVPLSPDAPIERLRTAEKQSVQIARALASGNAWLLILDEPTSALSDHEADRLLTRLEALRERGTAILYVSHKLEEVARLADDVTVLRDGRHVQTGPARDLSTADIVRLMVGRETALLSGQRPAENRPAQFFGQQTPVLNVRGLTRRPAFEDVSFDLRGGEVVGMFGIVGAGRTEVARVLFGLDRADAGTVTLNGRDARFRSPTAAVRAGLALVPEDRKLQGLLLDESLRRNVALPNLSWLRRHGPAGRLLPFVDTAAEWKLAQRSVRDLKVAARAGVEGRAGGLSGGNQQKVVLAKWLAGKPRVLILDEPTKGIDVGAKAEVYRLVRDLAAEGIAVLLISSELEEVLALSDRILVMRAGRVAATFAAEERPSRETILRHAVVREQPIVPTTGASA